ncbi:MAG TPA: DUF1761 domain-containing protein [Acidimicrobiia bacterium]
MEAEINWLAVLVSGLVLVALGFVWYLPSVFGRAWMGELGMTQEQAAEGWSGGVLVWTVIGALAKALVLAIIVAWSGAEGALEGLLVGLLIGIGLLLVNNSIRDTYEQRSARLSLITSGNDVVGSGLAGVILGAWM